LESGAELASFDASEMEPSSDTRLHQAFHSEILDNQRDIIVYLPPGYNPTRRRRYPVLYLKDGQNLFDASTAFGGVDWGANVTADRLIRAGDVEPLIIVGTYNTGDQRVDEYTPSRDRRLRRGGKADLYGRFLIEEVKPLIDEEYCTSQDRFDSALGGSSLGGLLSLYLGLRYEHVFGKLAILSPSVWWDRKRIIDEVKTLPHKTDQLIWLDVGTAEGKVTLRHARILRNALEAQGWEKEKDLAYLEAEGGVHNESSWGGRVEPMLRFLFPAGR
jgi:predicted alpha/beta superfamily hydrolase